MKGVNMRSNLRSHILAFSTGIICAAAFSLSSTVLAQNPPSDADRATATVESVNDQFHGGRELTFKMQLNAPLPEGAYFRVQLSPVGLDQQIAIGSGEPLNKDRTEFKLTTKLPEKITPGEWRIRVVWLFLAGVSQTSSTIATNPDFRFFVEGPKVEIPSSATATLTRDSQ
jgi:hypothetical protein